MYSKATLEESLNRFTAILNYDSVIGGIIGNAGLTSPEKVMVVGMIDMLKSHIEALDHLEVLKDTTKDLREDLEYANERIGLQDEALNYWANR